MEQINERISIHFAGNRGAWWMAFVDGQPLVKSNGTGRLWKSREAAIKAADKETRK